MLTFTEKKNQTHRLEITELLTQIRTYISPVYHVDYVTEFDEFFENVTPSQMAVNGIYQIGAETVNYKSLNAQQALALEKLILKVIIKNIAISPFNLKVKQLWLTKLNPKGLLGDVNTFLDVTFFGQTIIFNNIAKDAKVIAYKLHWEIGRALLDKLQEIVNVTKVQEALIKDLKDQNSIIYLCEALARKTPAALSLNTNFKCLRALFSQTKEKVVFLFIILTIAEDLRKYILGRKPVEALEPEFPPFVNYYYYNFMPNGMKLKLSRKESFNSKLPEEVMLQTLKTIRIKCLNILNVCSKILGIELSSIYVAAGIIYDCKFPDGKLGYKIAANVTVTHVFHKLPSVIHVSTKADSRVETTISNSTTQGYTEYTPLIKNDHMDGIMLDLDYWNASQGTFNLNFDFIKDFLTTFSDILKRNQNKDEVSLNDNQILFLNTFFNINLLCLKAHPIIYKQILHYALNFQKLEKLDVKSCKILPSILDDFRNKIYQKKFIFIQILRDLPILLRVNHFCFELRFDMRGRAYPWSSLFTYSDPLMKYFFSWGEQYPLTSKEKIAVAPMLAMQARTSCAKLFEAIPQTKKLTLLELYSLGVTKKVFESLLLYNDHVNIHDTTYPMQFYYSVDACSSGFQINTMLLRSKKLALACGLVGDVYKDLYQDFVVEFQQHIQNRTNSLQDGDGDGNLLTEFLVLARPFVRNNYNSFQTKTFISRLTKNKQLFQEFSSLYSSFTGNEEYTDRFLQGFKTLPLYTAFPRRKLYKLLVTEGVITVTQRKKLTKSAYLENLFKPTTIEVKKGLPSGKRKFNLLVYILALLCEQEGISRFSKVIPDVTRKMVKNAIMVTFYGASPKTRRTSYYDSYKEKQIEDGNLISKEDETVFRKFTFFLDFHLIQWIKKNFPEALYLRNTIRKLAISQTFEPMTIQSEHCCWYYAPTTIDTYSKTIYNKDYKLRKYSTELDYNKIQSAFLANYIQFCDATICSYVVADMKMQNIPIMTVHDCFKSPYQYKTQLELSISNSYKKFYAENFLEAHFLKKNSKFLELINTLRINENLDTFSVDEISSRTLTKS
jgi:hypothetical protein